MVDQQPPGNTAHDELRQQIPAYVSDLVLGRALVAHAALSAHLPGCAACRAEVDELAQLLRDAAATDLPAATTYAELSLDFLRPARPPPAGPWLVDTLGRLVISFSPALLEQIRPRGLRTAARSSAARTRLYQYEQVRFETVERRQAHAVKVDVFELGQSPSSLELVVHVPRPDRRPSDLAGSRVTLRGPVDERQQLTDRYGDTTFHGLSLADLPHIELLIAVPSEAG